MSDLPRPIPWLGPGASDEIVQTSPTKSKARVHLPMMQSRAPSRSVKGRGTPPSPLRALVTRLGFAAARRSGSQIPARRIIVFLVWARRVSQLVFLLLFVFLLTQTAFRGSFSAENEQIVRLPFTVEAFLLANPFVAALTVLATHTLYAGLAWSLIVLVLTLVVGRGFCGWICPFGTIHHVM